MHFKNSEHRSQAILQVIFLLFFANVYLFAETNDAFQPQLMAPSDGVQFYRKLQQAQQLYEKEKWAEAERLYKELAAEYALNGTIWGQYAKVLRQQEKFADAIKAYEKVINIQGPGLPFSGRYWIAVCHAKLGHIDAALDTLQKMVFQEAELMRPDLLVDPNFANLKDNPRFQKIAGKEDLSKVERNEGWRNDIDYLAAELKRNNPANMPISDEFLKRQRELKEQVPQLNDYEIIAGMGHMLNSLNRGHTNLWIGVPGSKLDLRPMPVRLYIFPEGIFITQGLQGNEDLAGAQVLKFGNTSAAEAFQRAKASRSTESEMEDVWSIPYLLELPAVLKGLGMIQNADRAELTLLMPDGISTKKTLGLMDDPERKRKLNSPPRVEAPLFLRNMNEMHWLQPMPEHRAIYVQVNNIMNDKDETMAQFGLTLRRAIQEQKPDNIILDIRHNNGGNTFTYVELLRTFIAFSAVEGHTVYALIGRNVYSAAANFSTDLERLVGPIFVGEPTSQIGNQWGDESQFVLPYSGQIGSFSGLRWQLSHPWDQRHSLAPQVPVELTAKAYFRGEDPALEAVLRLITDQNQR
jgi:tetratricopeptide (TPR) repeat protein